MKIFIFIFCGIIACAQGEKNGKLCADTEDAIEYAKCEKWKQLNEYYQKPTEELKANFNKCKNDYKRINSFLEYCDSLKKRIIQKFLMKKNQKPEFVGAGIRKTMTIKEAMEQIVEAAFHGHDGILCEKIEDATKYAKENDKWQYLEKYERYQPKEPQKYPEKYNKWIHTPFGSWMDNYASINSFLHYCDFLKTNNIEEGFNEKKFEFIAVRPKFVHGNGQQMLIIEAMEQIVKATEQITQEFKSLCVDIGKEKEYAKTDIWQHLADKLEHLEKNYGTTNYLKNLKNICKNINKFLNYCEFLNGTSISEGSGISAVRPIFANLNGQPMSIIEKMKEVVMNTNKELNAQLCTGMHYALDYAQKEEWQKLSKYAPQQTLPKKHKEDFDKLMSDYKEINRFLNYCNFLKEKKIAEDFTVKESEIFSGKPRNELFPIEKAMQKIIETANENGKKIYDKICMNIKEATEYSKSGEWMALKVTRKPKIGYSTWEKSYQSIERFLVYCNFLKENEDSRKWEPDYAGREYEFIALKPEFEDANKQPMATKQAMEKIVVKGNQALEDRTKSKLTIFAKSIQTRKNSPGMEFTNKSICHKVNLWAWRYMFAKCRANYSEDKKEAKRNLEKVKKHLKNGSELILHKPEAADSDDSSDFL